MLPKQNVQLGVTHTGYAKVMQLVKTYVQTREELTKDERLLLMLKITQLSRWEIEEMFKQGIINKTATPGPLVIPNP